MFGSLDKPFNLDIHPEHVTYFESINRVGLMFPSTFLFNIILCGYCIFNLCISKELESRFLALEYIYKTFLLEPWTTVNNDKYSGLLLSSYMCETKNIIIQL